MTPHSRRQWREILLIVLPTLALVIGAVLLALQFVEPAPPRRIVMTTGSAQGAYTKYAEQYAKILARSGVTLEVKPSAGSIENIERLLDRKSNVQLAFVQGGIADPAAHPGLVSLGRAFLEPMWVFHRSNFEIDSLNDLKGLKVAVGAEGSGTRVLAMKLLEANKLDGTNTTFVGSKPADSANQLIAGEIDAAFYTMAAASDLAQKLIHAPNVKIANLKQADAYTRVFPFLQKIVLPAGVADLGLNLPATDITMVAPVASVVARQDLHPALVSLLVEAMKEVHAQPGLFQKANEFPQGVESDLPLHADAARFHKTGLPFLQRYLPFWLATFIDRTAVLLIPILTISLPLIRLIPMMYQWRIRRRILFWYDRLKKLEARVRADSSAGALPTYTAEIERIEDAVSVIPVPYMYSDQLYNLRSAVELVRQRLKSKQEQSRNAAMPQMWPSSEAKLG
ncbi:MAG: TAXI family TRAP transporter solute-binding subunit [Hyphomicrobiaceae bacterium]|nr:TAXI family TRAP transporter solute-binding subunit [Hyphomicrobiaceae bacterium]